jgi:hypothetical protein
VDGILAESNLADAESIVVPGEDVCDEVIWDLERKQKC